MRGPRAPRRTGPAHEGIKHQKAFEKLLMRWTQTRPAHDQNLHTLRQVNYSCADPMRLGAQVRRTTKNPYLNNSFSQP